MNTKKVTSKPQYKFVYLAFTISGLLMLVLAKDFSWAGIFLSLAIVFHPCAYTHFKELSFAQKTLILTQMGIAILLIGINMFMVATS